MPSFKSIFIFTVSFLFIFFITAISLLAGGGGGDEAALVNNVSTENLSGLNLWVVNTYNENRILLAIVTTISMGVVGIIIAYVTDIFLKMFGLQVSKIEHKE